MRVLKGQALAYYKGLIYKHTTWQITLSQSQLNRVIEYKRGAKECK